MPRPQFLIATVVALVFIAAAVAFASQRSGDAWVPLAAVCAGVAVAVEATGLAVGRRHSA